MIVRNLFQLSFFTCFLLFLPAITYAQVNVVPSENKVIIEGKVFYLHVVKPGQTLYSISNAYKISETDIVKENPGVDAGLQVGQVIKIPFSSNRDLVSQITGPIDSLFTHHSVQQGETMYSISKMYGLSMEELEKNNPQVINHDLKTGQILNIFRINNEVVTGEFITHKVRRKETIFGISRMYNISEDELKKYNPELMENFPKPGQTLKIPAKQPIVAILPKTIAERKDSIPGYEILKYDTIKIADAYSKYLENRPDFSGKTYNVAYLIPFDYRVNEAPPTDDNNTISKDNVNMAEQQANSYDQMLSSRNFLEFLEGSLLAIDSLKNQGISVNIFVYDTKKSPERMREILNSREFQKIDLIIGPFYAYNVDLVSKYSLENRVPMVSPVSGEDGMVNQNPFFFQMNTGYKTEFDRIADYASGFPNKNIVLIHGVDSLENLKFNYLKNDLANRLTLMNPADSQAVKEIKYDYAVKGSLAQELLSSLSPDKENLVIVPEIDEAFVSTVVTQLYFQLKSYRISLVGMPHWNAFQNIDFMYFHKLSLTYFTPYYYSYDSANVLHFLKDYRTSFYSEPVTLTKKGGSYAFLGYDISYSFLELMHKYGKRFILHLNESSGLQLMNDFHFVPVGEGGGFENRSLMLVKFFEDLSIKAEPYRIAVPDESHQKTIPEVPYLDIQ